MELNGVILAGSILTGSVDGRLCIQCINDMKCTVMYHVQAAGPRSANFCISVHVDKECLPANFHPNR